MVIEVRAQAASGWRGGGIDYKEPEEIFSGEEKLYIFISLWASQVYVFVKTKKQTFKICTFYAT